MRQRGQPASAQSLQRPCRSHTFPDLREARALDYDLCRHVLGDSLNAMSLHNAYIQPGTKKALQELGT